MAWHLSEFLSEARVLPGAMYRLENIISVRSWTPTAVPGGPSTGIFVNHV